MEIFQRTELIAGKAMMEAASSCRVIIFGLGGVGSWCAEALIRSGIGHLTLVDSDTIAVSNINRQLPALCSTVGQVKVDVLRSRLLEINPDADITAIHAFYEPETAENFHIRDYDFCIDAIDSLSSKAHLIMHCTDPATAPRSSFFSSMGAALKLHGTMVNVAEFAKVQGCPLARALRQRFKRQGVWPRRKFKCVYSPERLTNRESSTSGEYANGTFAHTTAIFGMNLAGLVIEKLYEQSASAGV